MTSNRSANRQQMSSTLLRPCFTPPRPVPPRRYEVLSAERTSAAARSDEGSLDGRCAAEVWSWYSPHPREAGIAGRRFVGLAGKLANVPLLYAIAEVAVEGHHAAGGLIEPYLRSRIARINETLRDMEKAEERMPETRRGMRSMGEILSGLYKQNHPSGRRIA